MISYLIGKLIHKSEGSIIVETNNIGYKLAVSNNTLSTLPLVGEDVKVFTYMIVRDDEISLVGFSDMEEKKLFLDLITVSSVGPKLALAVLSGMKLSDLTIAILKEDVNTISSIKGIGKKTSERIVLELKSKVSTVNLDSVQNFNDNLPGNEIDEAAQALISLGMNKTEAYKSARNCAVLGDGVEEIITKALKGIGR